MQFEDMEPEIRQLTGHLDRVVPRSDGVRRGPMPTNSHVLPSSMPSA